MEIVIWGRIGVSIVLLVLQIFMAAVSTPDSALFSQIFLLLLLVVTTLYSLLTVLRHASEDRVPWLTNMGKIIEQPRIGRLSLLYLVVSVAVATLGIQTTIANYGDIFGSEGWITSVVMMLLIFLLSFTIPLDQWDRIRVPLIALNPVLVLINFSIITGSLSGNRDVLAFFFVFILLPIFTLLLVSNAHMVAKKAEMGYISSLRFPTLVIVFSAPIQIIYVFVLINDAFEPQFTRYMFVMGAVLLPLSVIIGYRLAFENLRRYLQVVILLVYISFLLAIVFPVYFEFLDELGVIFGEITGSDAIESGSFLLMVGIPTPLFTGAGIALITKYWRSTQLTSTEEIELYPLMDDEE